MANDKATANERKTRSGEYMVHPFPNRGFSAKGGYVLSTKSQPPPALAGKLLSSNLVSQKAFHPR